MIDDISNMAKNIQLKIREFSETIGGHKQSEYISIKKRHFDLLQDLRANNPEKYKKMIYFATIYPTLDIDKRAESSSQFFSDF